MCWPWVYIYIYIYIYIYTYRTQIYRKRNYTVAPERLSVRFIMSISIKLYMTKDLTRHHKPRQIRYPHIEIQFYYTTRNIKRLTDSSKVQHLERWPFVREKQFLYEEGPTFETLDFTIRISCNPTFSYFDLYLYSASTPHTTFIEVLL